MGMDIEFGLIDKEKAKELFRLENPEYVNGKQVFIHKGYKLIREHFNCVFELRKNDLAVLVCSRHFGYNYFSDYGTYILMSGQDVECIIAVTEKLAETNYEGYEEVQDWDDVRLLFLDNLKNLRNMVTDDKLFVFHWYG